jgi:acyl-CoA synthetase (AMP-forming)/AMP-acid ligase II
MGHPSVQEAAVIGIAHEKWQERPLLLIVPKPNKKPTKEEILAYMKGKVVAWSVPDDVVFVSSLPHTATVSCCLLSLYCCAATLTRSFRCSQGKLLKTKLREMFKNHQLPEINHPLRSAL